MSKLEQLDYTDYLTSKKLSDLGVNIDSNMLWISSKQTGTKLYRRYPDFKYRCLDQYNTFSESCILESSFFKTYRSYNLQQIISQFPSSIMIKITKGISYADQIHILEDVYENKIIKERVIGISSVSSDKNHQSLVNELSLLLIELLDSGKFKLNKKLENE